MAQSQTTSRQRVSFDTNTVIMTSTSRLRHIVLSQLVQVSEKETELISIPRPRDGYWGIDVKSIISTISHSRTSESLSVRSVSVTDAICSSFWTNIDCNGFIIIDMLSEAIKFSEKTGTDLELFINSFKRIIDENNIILTDTRYPPRPICSDIERFVSVETMDRCKQLFASNEQHIQQNLFDYAKKVNA